LIIKNRYRDADLTSVLRPTAEILSFASPKESIQRKIDPDATCFLRSSLLQGGVGRVISGPPSTRRILAAPLRAFSGKSPCARRGITGEVLILSLFANFLFY